MHDVLLLSQPDFRLYKCFCTSPAHKDYTLTLNISPEWNVIYLFLNTIYKKKRLVLIYASDDSKTEYSVECYQFIGQNFILVHIIRMGVLLQNGLQALCWAMFNVEERLPSLLINICGASLLYSELISLIKSILNKTQYQSC